MIIGINHKGLKALYDTGKPKGLPADMVRRISTILADMDAGTDLDALSRPSLRLHELKGDLAGFWSVSVNGQWRIIFTHEDGKFDKLDLVDYH